MGYVLLCCRPRSLPHLCFLSDRFKLVEQVEARLKYFAGTSSLQKLHGERGAANSSISSSHFFLSLAHGKT